MMNAIKQSCCRGLFLAAFLFSAGSGVGAASLELVGELPPSGGIRPDFIEAIQGLDHDPNEIVIAVRNQGANCGFGTPVSIWKATLDPTTGDLVSLVNKRQLSGIQTTRSIVFESSDGTLFTGSGWCGYKPPYYSTDHGETWRTADSGAVHPPNSTFSYAELDGTVYAGTGYSPWTGQVYRWLGNGNWRLVLDLGRVRNTVSDLIIHENRLFAGAWAWGDDGTTPIYFSYDGDTFSPTTGIPSSFSAELFVVVSGKLLAIASEPSQGKKLYRWFGDTNSWTELANFNFKYSGRSVAAHGPDLYVLGRAPGEASYLHRSGDLAQTWQHVAAVDGSALAVHDGNLYIGTRHDSSDTAYLYRLRLNRPPVADAGPDEIVECTDDQRTPVYLDGSGSHDPDGDALSYEWTFADGGRVFGVQPTVLLPLGSYFITLTVDDGHGGTHEDDVTISVEDTVPPAMQSLSANPGILWPPNHKMKSISIEVASSDVCDHEPPVCRIVGVASNEPQNGLGDGDAAPDWVMTSDLTVDLRAERAGNGSGRTYTLEIACEDASDNVATASVTVSVPHDRK